MLKSASLTSIVSIFTLAMLTGCGESVDPTILAVREKLVLSAAPEGSSSISKIRATLSGDSAEPSTDLVVRGRIHAGDVPPWETGKAAFILTDATGHEGEEDHDPHTCPFCSRNIKDYTAMVRFSDQNGVLEIDSRELFDVEEKQMINIKGTGVLDADGLLQIEAESIFIEKKE